MKEAFIRLFTIAVTTTALLGLTYQVDALSQYRPWVPGEAVPFAFWLGDEEASPNTLPAFGGDQYQVATANDMASAEAAGVSAELMAEAVAFDENSGNSDELIAPPTLIPATSPVPTATEAQSPGTDPLNIPVVSPAETPSEVVVGAAEDSPMPNPEESEPTPPPLTIEASEWEGITREIEDPTGHALDHFYGSLLKTALQQDAHVTRISHWGASVIGADGMTHVARRKLQARFGSAGKGWVNMAPGWHWYRQKDVIFRPNNWSGKTVTSNRLRNDRWAAGFYGYGGVAARGYAGANTKYTAYANELELYYLAYPGGGDVQIRTEGQEPILISTDAETPTDSWHTVRVDGDGENTFQVRAKGRVHLYGVTLERAGPGIVYDCIGMIGTRSSRLLNYDPEHWARQVAHRNPDLQIIMFGGNEVGDSGSLATYEEKYREALQRLRAGAQAASCLMMTPVDHGERKRGRIRTVPRLLRMIPIQERLAKEMGCGFLNTFEAMGGEGAIGRWYYDVRPRLAWADFAHLTPAGDQVLGAMIYKAIMKGFSDWLQRGTTPQAATTPSAPEVSSPTPETSSPETPAPEAPEPETTRPLPAPEAPEPETTRPLPAPTAGENP